MSLSASMWTGVSGLLAHGDRMNVIGNNIANVNTVGFKGSRMHFADFISQDIGTTGNFASQVGRGVSIHAVYTDFSQAGYETTNEATDLAIAGRGFFGVSPKDEQSRFYTRAGNFRFDRDGYLVDPNGHVLQGWRLESRPAEPAQDIVSTDADTFTEEVNRVGAIGDIRIGAGGIAEPSHTNTISLITQLDNGQGGNNSLDATDPFFALAKSWNGSLDTPLEDTQYAYSTSILVYDEAGSAHDMTVYYDQVSNADGKNVWEYIVTIDPDEDRRNLGGVDVEGEGKGLLMFGTMEFNSAGQIEDISAYTPASNANMGVGQPLNLAEWYPTEISNKGLPLMAANFTGLSNASAVLDSAGQPINPVPPNAEGKLIELNFGLSTDPSSTWDFGVDGFGPASSIGNETGNPDALEDLPGFGTSAKRSASSTTAFDASSATLFQAQDGYTFGFLQTINVNQDGVIEGRFSNGVTLQLFQVTLFDFASDVGLRREGNNLFSETRESPLSTSQPPGSAGLGSIASSSLEQSNVDLAKEFVDMIATQRGFSANGKVITTTDQMLSEVIMLKR